MSREFEVLLEGGAPWGFRLHGGKEFRLPLRVVKVETGGKAHAAGVRVDDKVIEINGRSVENLYHTEALAAVKKANDRLYLRTKREVVDETASKQTADSSLVAEQSKKAKDTEMIQIKSYPPALVVPMKPASATSIPVDQAPHEDAPMQMYSDLQPYDYDGSEWSPDMINEIVRTPDPISISREEDRNNRSSDSAFEISYGYNIPRSGSLPRSLGKKIKNDMDHKSSTLPRKKSQGTPTWYKEMYNEIHKTMAGQSHLSRLLTADAAKGAFRDYDGASSTSSIGNQGRRQRPKSIHVDRFVFENFDARDSANAYDANIPRQDTEKKEKRLSVHSSRYREFQRGGGIPSTGLADTTGDSVLTASKRYSQPIHARSRSQDDILTGSTHGLPYQKSDRSRENKEPQDPTKFEYNNPPDYLELRKKAEAEGTLREERERELRMLQEARKKWLEEEEEMRKENAKRMDTKKKLEAGRQRAHEEDERQKRIQYEIQEQRRQEEEERRRDYNKLLLDKEDARKDASLSNDSSSAHFLGKARGLYSFKAQSPAEISFKKGDIVNVMKQVDENWYEGEVLGHIGIFPVSYVEILEEEPEVVQESQASDVPDIALQIEEGLARARYTFQAENDGELSFKKNDMLTLLRQLDDNWYEGEIGDQIGIFPVAYVEVLKTPRLIEKDFVSGKLDVISVDEDAPSNQRKTPLVNGSSKEEHPNMGHHVQDKSESSYTNDLNKVPPEYGKPDTAMETGAWEGERHRAVFGYNSMNQDELSLKEGDIIYVLEKCDDGWFVGTCKRSGLFGTFPGNYVVPV